MVEELHLMTQDNQPYGSARKCCERCGRLVTGNMIYAETNAEYKDALSHGHNGKTYVACDIRSC